MARFEIAYPYTKRYEGGYANIKGDRGKETYCGISRKYFPNWIGWDFIDKQVHPIPHNKVFPELERFVTNFFEVNFWTRLNLSFLEQQVSNQVFDFAVHSGRGTATKNLQSVLNNKFGARLKIDGGLGKKTITAANAVDSIELAKAVLNQRAAYLDIVDDSQPQFEEGWLWRIEKLRASIPQAAAVSYSFAAVIGLGLTVFF